MEQCNVALFGCGTVGMGVAQALLGDGALRARLGDRVRLKYVVDLRTVRSAPASATASA